MGLVKHKDEGREDTTEDELGKNREWRVVWQVTKEQKKQLNGSLQHLLWQVAISCAGLIFHQIPGAGYSLKRFSSPKP